MANTVTLVSTTDSEADVRAALGAGPAEAETPVAISATPAAMSADTPVPPEGVVPETPAAPLAAAPVPDVAPAAKLTPTPEEKQLAQDRIDKLTWERREAERQAVAERDQRVVLERELAALRGQPAQSPPVQAEPAPTPIVAKPKAEDFPTYEDFIEALTDWKAEQKIAPLRQDLPQAIEQRMAVERGAAIAQQVQQQMLAAQTRVVTKGAEVHPDFNQVMTQAEQQGIRWAPLVTDVILNHPIGPSVAYELAQNLQESARLSALSQVNPMVASIELGRFIAGVEAKHAAAYGAGSVAPAPIMAQPEPAPVATLPPSGAPPPIQPVAAAPTRSTVPLDQMDFKSYDRVRAEQERKRFMR